MSWETDRERGALYFRVQREASSRGNAGRFATEFTEDAEELGPSVFLGRLLLLLLIISVILLIVPYPVA